MAYNQSGNPYGSPSPAEGYGSPAYGRPYQTTEQHEMHQYSPTQNGGGANPYAGASTGGLSLQDFLSRVSHVRNEIRSLANDVQHISTLHQQALADAGDASAQRKLDDLVASTQVKTSSIRDQIRDLKTDVERTPAGDGGGSLKKTQWEALNRDFQKELHGYVQEEQAYRSRYRDQIARQYRIVNPDASEDEVRRAAEMDWGNEGVFQTALRSNRTNQASAVLGSVRARHNELLNIERSITELAALMQDLDTMIIQQEPLVERAQEQTENAVQHLEEGNKEIDKAQESARRRRKLKWICLGITILIILGVALGVGLGVGLGKKATDAVTGNSGNSGNATKARRMLEDLVTPGEQARREVEKLMEPVARALREGTPQHKE